MAWHDGTGETLGPLETGLHTVPEIDQTLDQRQVNKKDHETALDP